MSRYKEEKEAFVSDTTGSTISHILQISSITVSSLALYFVLHSRYHILSSPRRTLWTGLALEFALLVVPILLGLTLSSETPVRVSLPICIMSLVAFMAPTHAPEEPASELLSSPLRRATSPPLAARPPTAIPPLHSLTIYRAQMLLLTFIAILAVDFPVFPRSLAKCESWGTSMMDLGVGSFVFSQGLVSAVPVVRNPDQLSEPILPKFLATLRKILPVLALGLVRVALVKGTEYPEHVTEYGVHWNFFITLALLPLASVFLHPLVMDLPVWAVGLVLTAAHQAMLSLSSLQLWTLSDERIGLIGQNKEGLVSLPGYLAIHVIGFSTGLLVLPSSPSQLRRRRTQQRERASSSCSMQDSFKEKISARKLAAGMTNGRQLDKTATELCGIVIVWWTLFAVARWIGGGGTDTVSRRLANMPYVLLTVAYNSLFLLSYIVLEIAFSPSTATPSKRSRAKPDSSDKMGPVELAANLSSIRDDYAGLHNRKSMSSPVVEQEATSSLRRISTEEEVESGEVSVSPPMSEPRRQRPLRAPLLFEALNLNGLVLFLLANVMTGLVNMSMQTMYALDGVAMAVLLIYLGTISGIAWLFRGRRLLRL